MSMRGRAFMPSRRGCDVRAVAEPGTSQSWPQLLDQTIVYIIVALCADESIAAYYSVYNGYIG
eukprot:1332210-Amorphochlora_amoeboformis.AAC.3